MNILSCIGTCHEHVCGELGSVLMSDARDLSLSGCGGLRSIKFDAVDKVVGQ